MTPRASPVNLPHPLPPVTDRVAYMTQDGCMGLNVAYTSQGVANKQH